MSDAYEWYERLVATLRERRRAPDWDVDGDDPFLETMDFFYWRMTDEERALVHNEGWKSDPAQYDAWTAASPMVERGTDDLDDDSSLGQPPRATRAQAA